MDWSCYGTHQSYIIRYFLISFIDNPVDKSAPSTVYSIDYVHGYACEKSRSNVYCGPNGTVIYPAAALGIVQSISSGSQMYFGGGVVDSKAKNVSADDQCHTDDILCISVRGNTVATGQVGSSPVVFIWDASSQQKLARCKIPKGGRGVRAVAISQDGSHVAAVDMSNNHNVFVFKTADGSCVMNQPGDTADIFDVAFSQQAGSMDFCTVGAKHIKFWTVGGDVNKGLFGKGEPTSFTSVAYNYEGVCFTGGVNSKIYVWKGRNFE